MRGSCERSVSEPGPANSGRYGIAPFSWSFFVNWVDTVPAVLSSERRCKKSKRKQPGRNTYELRTAGFETYGMNGTPKLTRVQKPFAIDGATPSPKRNALPPCWR